MKILIVAATLLEIEPFLKKWNFDYNSKKISSQIINNIETHIIITGVGMIAAAANVTNKLAQDKFNLVLNIGIAGTFDSTITLGSLYSVEIDYIADLGIEAKQQFIHVRQMGLAKEEEIKLLAKLGKYDRFLKKIPKGIAVTRNSSTDNESMVSYIQQEFKPTLESMEGAAVLYASKLFNIPCIQVRAVSNIVGERDKSKWNIKLAVENSSNFLNEFLDTIESA